MGVVDQQQESLELISDIEGFSWISIGDWWSYLSPTGEFAPEAELIPILDAPVSPGRLWRFRSPGKWGVYVTNPDVDLLAVTKEVAFIPLVESGQAVVRVATGEFRSYPLSEPVLDGMPLVSRTSTGCEVWDYVVTLPRGVYPMTVQKDRYGRVLAAFIHTEG